MLYANGAPKEMTFWTLAHQEELLSNWDRVQAKPALERIAGLDAD
jgi:hypothetical protein